ncbi:MAG: hypothetical protein ACREDY_12800 [Bradyrhizobium sp.]
MEPVGALRGCHGAMAVRSKKANENVSQRRTPILSTGPGERMTPEQQTLLRRLASDGYELEAFSDQLTQSEAAKRISMLQAKLKLLDEPPHTL